MPSSDPRPTRPLQRPLFSPAGFAALDALVRRAPLVAFDFDGTLAPIVDRPDDARLPSATARRLARLAERLPVAIVTGRAVDDVRARLGFQPAFVVGSHGAEGDTPPVDAATLAARLDALRERLADGADAMDGHGIEAEDKGLSIALHYRRAADPPRAGAFAHALLADAGPDVRVFGGKMVVNATAADAPDKATALRALLARTGRDAAFFAGDDVNDEPVFRAAGPRWVTARVGGPDPASAAGWWIASPSDMPALLERLLAGAAIAGEGSADPRGP